MKDILLALIILAYVIPFTYMLIFDIVDVYNRLSAVFRNRLKPVVAVMIRSFVN